LLLSSKRRLVIVGQLTGRPDLFCNEPATLGCVLSANCLSFEAVVIYQPISTALKRTVKHAVAK
jgi:hypothetical protein